MKECSGSFEDVLGNTVKLYVEFEGIPKQIDL